MNGFAIFAKTFDYMKRKLLERTAYSERIGVLFPKDSLVKRVIGYVYHSIF